MSDDKTKAGAADRSRININEDYELRYWSLKLDASINELKAAATAVGPMADDVVRYLKKR